MLDFTPATTKQDVTLDDGVTTIKGVVEYDEGSGTPGTIPSEDHWNSLWVEVCNVIKEGGGSIATTVVGDTRNVLKAAIKKVASKWGSEATAFTGPDWKTDTATVSNPSGGATQTIDVALIDRGTVVEVHLGAMAGSVSGDGAGTTVKITPVTDPTFFSSVVPGDAFLPFIHNFTLDARSIHRPDGISWLSISMEGSYSGTVQWAGPVVLFFSKLGV